MNSNRKPKVLIFIVAYHAETTITNVVSRIPKNLSNDYQVDILIIDDSSRDHTFERSHELSQRSDLPFNVRVLFNPVNQGYGGNQKLGYHYAIDQDYDVVVLLHGDGQYAPECLPDLLKPLIHEGAAAVFGSRMLTSGGALRGGMPLYKFVGNKVLTNIQNRMLATELSEFHSGYRLYSVSALKAIPFERNSNDFHFDTEIIIQLVLAKLPIVELPIPTFYGDEICRVDGMKYAWNVLKATARARLQEWSLFYDRRYDCSAGTRAVSRMSFESTHSAAFEMVPANSKVLELGCTGSYVAADLQRQKGCQTAGVATYPLRSEGLNKVYVRDLNQGLADIPVADNNYVLLLDVLEHLNSPEEFLDELREKMGKAELIVSTGNVAFFITRCMLFLGQFNYGKRGILDLTHTRLFTFSSLTRMLEQAGFRVFDKKAVPAPYPLAIGDNKISRFLLRIHRFLNRLSPSLFAYQMIFRASALPTVKSLLTDAEEISDQKARVLNSSMSATA